jgi:thiamine pyrophosphate-dependent acetolactate synthase large subunit-like protein
MQQHQQSTEHALLQQRYEQWQQEIAAVAAGGVAVAQSEPGICRTESGAAANNRWHYW